MLTRVVAICIGICCSMGGVSQTHRDSMAIQQKTEVSPDPILLTNGNVLYDFSKAYFGRLRVDISSLGLGDSVVIYIGEKKDVTGKIDRNPGGTIRAYRYRLVKQQEQQFIYLPDRPDTRNTTGNAIRLPAYMGIVAPFRYVEVEKNADKIRISREVFHYRFNDNASYFNSSDSVLNEIWNLCKHTIKATSFTGYYIDGDRERIPYEADALINQLSHYALDKEYELARNTFEYLLQHPTWPTEWHLQTHQIAWYDYWFTGNLNLIKKHYDFLQLKTLEAFRQPNGLISTTAQPQRVSFLDSIHFASFDAKQVIRDITDWPQRKIKLPGEYPGEADGFVFCDYNSVVNAYYYKSLLLMKAFAKLLGKQADVGKYEQKAREVKQAFTDWFIDKKTGLVRDGDTTNHSSIHANFFALCFGLVSKEHTPAVLQYLQQRGMACSVYGSQFLMDALYNEGMEDFALYMLTKRDERSWFHMLELQAGMTMEAWDIKYKPNLDWNHAWGAAPTNLIAFRLMGIRPAAAGFTKAYIEPQVGKLTEAVIRLPTAQGEIYEKVSQNASRYQVVLHIPKGVTATLVLPAFTGKSQNIQIVGSSIKPILSANKYICKQVSGSIEVTIKK